MLVVPDPPADDAADKPPPARDRREPLGGGDQLELLDETDDPRVGFLGVDALVTRFARPEAPHAGPPRTELGWPVRPAKRARALSENVAKSLPQLRFVKCAIAT